MRYLLIQVTGVARQWKTRWRQEKDTNHHIQEQFNSCERECYLLIDNLQVLFILNYENDVQNMSFSSTLTFTKDI